MSGKAIGLDEAAQIDQRFDALARGELAGAVLLFDALRAARYERRPVLRLELAQQLIVTIRHGSTLEHTIVRPRSQWCSARAPSWPALLERHRRWSLLANAARRAAAAARAGDRRARGTRRRPRSASPSGRAGCCS